MQFDQIVGKIDPRIVLTGESKLTSVFLELGSGQENNQRGAGLGGDPLVFALVVPAKHIATLNIPTAATDGKCFYWNPKWLASKSLLGIRLACFHESMHALYMHYQRRGNRNPQLWNIAVDFIANGMIMEDLLLRKGSEAKALKAFIDGLGNFCTLEQCIALYKNPEIPVKGMEFWIPEPKIVLPAPDEDRELTDLEQRAIDNKTIDFKFFYADPHLKEEMKRPERIYDVLYKHAPRCPECNKIGMIPIPTNQKSAKDGKEEFNSQSDQCSDSDANGDKHHHSPIDNSNAPDRVLPGEDEGSGSGGEQPGSPNGSSADQKVGAPGPGKCGTCASSYSIFDVGDLLDEHLESVEDESELIKRVSDAIQTAKTMAGNVPAALISELTILSAPRIRYQDLIRTTLHRARAGNSKNDYSHYRTRPLFAGMMIPQKKSMIAKFVCLLDTSASMKAEDKALGVSQLISLDERSEGIIVCGDAKIYWDGATKIKKCNVEELSKIKVEGGGGTMLHSFFTDYKKKLGDADFLVIISDCQFNPKDEERFVNPKIPVFWLTVAAADFKAPFGRVFSLLD
jgi:predicted metal-dependent peptidase